MYIFVLKPVLILYFTILYYTTLYYSCLIYKRIWTKIHTVPNITDFFWRFNLQEKEEEKLKYIEKSGLEHINFSFYFWYSKPGTYLNSADIWANEYFDNNYN